MAFTAPAAPAFMLSLLKTRLLSLGELFTGQHEGSWLVWEPGKWSASGVFEATKVAKEAAPKSMVADSLSFHLKLRQPLKLGRATNCDIVINDATVSREHLAFEPDADGVSWKLRVLSATGSTSVEGILRVPGTELTLTSGMQIRIGDVSLSFWDSKGLERRLLGT